MKLNEFINQATENQIKEEVYSLNHCVMTEDYELEFKTPTDLSDGLGVSILTTKSIKVNHETKTIEVELQT